MNLERAIEIAVSAHKGVLDKSNRLIVRMEAISRLIGPNYQVLDLQLGSKKPALWRTILSV